METFFGINGGYDNKEILGASLMNFQDDVVTSLNSKTRSK